ncbi:hypothetical protein CJ030_MR0G006502 [Morella rubra]|uniref:Uncharacterized protein n=1 Tax=Morella rubra TaxID=262757 RepID=A0A6A1UKN4_9ROSI|nr:hypothetical protein CJ030_MR0G006502 [Morella rubra]
MGLKTNLSPIAVAKGSEQSTISESNCQSVMSSFFSPPHFSILTETRKSCLLSMPVKLRLSLILRLQSNLKDSNAVKEALDQLNEIGWAKRWSSQPYVSCRMTSLREQTTLGMKNAENLAIPSVRNDVSVYLD